MESFHSKCQRDVMLYTGLHLASAADAIYTMSLKKLYPYGFVA